MNGLLRSMCALCIALVLAAPAFAQTPIPIAEAAPAPAADATSGASSAEAAPAEAVSGASAEGVSGASSAAGPSDAGVNAAKPFLGFKSKYSFHETAGWGSAGLLFAAGAVGAVRAYTLIVPAHEYRDSLGMNDEDQVGAECAAKIRELWNQGQGLRWAHVSLLAAGEGLYLADAITGISWIDASKPASTRSKLHRWAFYGHATLMASEFVLGLLSSDALARGDHELVSSLGVAHAAVGFAIPALIGAAGAVESLGAKRP